VAGSRSCLSWRASRHAQRITAFSKRRCVVGRQCGCIGLAERARLLPPPWQMRDSVPLLHIEAVADEAKEEAESLLPSPAPPAPPSPPSLLPVPAPPALERPPGAGTLAHRRSRRQMLSPQGTVDIDRVLIPTARLIKDRVTGNPSHIVSARPLDGRLGAGRTHLLMGRSLSSLAGV
jgi:hypothetical protein